MRMWSKSSCICIRICVGEGEQVCVVDVLRIQIGCTGSFGSSRQIIRTVAPREYFQSNLLRCCNLPLRHPAVAAWPPGPRCTSAPGTGLPNGRRTEPLADQCKRRRTRSGYNAIADPLSGSPRSRDDSRLTSHDLAVLK
jgi:hypothetical protein